MCRVFEKMFWFLKVKSTSLALLVKIAIICYDKVHWDHFGGTIVAVLI
jgi:hypothetical protein